MPSHKNWFHAAKIIWQPLVEAATSRSLLHYEDLAPLIPTNNLNVGRALGPVQTFCMETARPPLTALVVNKNELVPGPGFIAWDIEDLDRAHAAVFDYDWRSLKNPFGEITPEDSLESLTGQLLADPHQSETVYRLVPDRGVGQQVFRHALLEAYDGACAMCGLTFPEALSAAHIVPWYQSSPQQKLDVRNGLLLCGTHHLLFDQGLMRVTTDYRIVYNNKYPDLSTYSDSDKAATLKLDGQKLRLPEDERLHPQFPE
ncbi:HNH endonuclease [Afifella sp. H1R]|uniref:HNH endonuclease n=1 Tax=Afifella sp. H1R TaxID=2908841 RepID=UPI001F2FBC66|nr:HNH endonuclease [Afifella sp. H1R]MCF1504669.1 HNH endonuclease [Afifella sp. H1R]